jgi:hypothetical protein
MNCCTTGTFDSCQRDGYYLETLLIRGGSAIERRNTHRAITEGGNCCLTNSTSGEFASHGDVESSPLRQVQTVDSQAGSTLALYTSSWGGVPCHKWTKESGMTSTLKDSRSGRKMGSLAHDCMAPVFYLFFICASSFGVSCGVTAGEHVNSWT